MTDTGRPAGSTGSTFTRRAALTTLGATAGALAVDSCCAPAFASSTPADAPVPPDAYQLTGDAQGFRTVLTLLGTKGGPGPEAGRSGVASLLTVGDRHYLIDAGACSARRLFQTGVDATRLNAIFVTHLHSDHLADLFNIFWLNNYGGTQQNPRPIPIHGPGPAGHLPPPYGGQPVPVVDPSHPTPGLSELMQNLLQAYAYDINIRNNEDGEPANDYERLFRVHELQPPANVPATPANPAPPMAPFEIFQDDYVRVTAILVPHGRVFPSFALRFETDDGVVTFSGDTGVTPNIPTLAAGSDVLVHEVIDLDYIRQRGYGPGLIEHMRQAHTDAPEVGRAATASAAKQVVLSHLVPADPRQVDDDRWSARVRQRYSGSVLPGHDLHQIGIGTRNT